MRIKIFFKMFTTLALIIMFFCTIALVGLFFLSITLRGNLESKYLLSPVAENDDAEYLLVKKSYSSDIYEVVTDQVMIRENISDFRIDNYSVINGGFGADGSFHLYRDGLLINGVKYDSRYTKQIEYGTIQFQQMNQLQYQLLMSHEIVEQDQIHTILRKNRSEKAVSYYYVHGSDLESIDHVYLLTSYKRIENIPELQWLSEDLIDYTIKRETMNGHMTEHRYFRLSDCSLSPVYTNILTIVDNLIVYGKTYNSEQSKIIVHDLFNEELCYTEYLVDSPANGSPVSAFIMEDGSLSIEYFGQGGRVERKVLN